MNIRSHSKRIRISKKRNELWLYIKEGHDSLTTITALILFRVTILINYKGEAWVCLGELCWGLKKKILNVFPTQGGNKRPVGWPSNLNIECKKGKKKKWEMMHCFLTASFSASPGSSFSENLRRISGWIIGQASLAVSVVRFLAEKVCFDNHEYLFMTIIYQAQSTGALTITSAPRKGL